MLSCYNKSSRQGDSQNEKLSKFRILQFFNATSKSEHSFKTFHMSPQVHRLAHVPLEIVILVFVGKDSLDSLYLEKSKVYHRLNRFLMYLVEILLEILVDAR